ncbi:hypothetical protein FLONG3_6437 [Fusarium longipes]|uniref:Enoyl reductase (ER) domain-containing protein n=1 Tax=Fusarium longipes TaxID=694270 RepID=A0A395SL15_9HYPO|nr:hypothetical protein FLONG3_6437 [Fusarium longipes]
MASSTPQQSQGQDNREGEQNRRLGDVREPYLEDPSDHEKGRRKPRQRGPPTRHHRKSPRQPRAYSTDNYYADYAADTQPSPFEAPYGLESRGDVQYFQDVDFYQRDTNTWYPQPNSGSRSTYPGGYSGSYSYPSDPHSYFPGVSPMLTPYSQSGTYPQLPNTQPPTGYEEDYASPTAYDSPPVPQYPQYPTRAPRRPPPQPLVPRQPTSDPQYAMTGAIQEIPERLSKKKHSSRRRDSASSTSDPRTMQVMDQVLEGINRVQRQLEDRSSEVRSDPGWFWSGRRPRSVSTASQYVIDETRSLDVERQEREHLVGIINRLLEDRARQGYQHPYLYSQRKDIAAMIENSIGLDESEMNRALVRHGDDKEITSKLDAILDLLVERNQPPRSLSQEYRGHRQDHRVPRGNHTTVSISSSRQPDVRRQVLQRRASATQPSTRERQDAFQYTAHSSNQSRVRRKVGKVAGPDEEEPDGELDEEYDLFQGYDTQDSPLQENLRAMRLGLARDTTDDQTTSEAVSDQQTGGITRRANRRMSEGSEQRMRPRYYATVEDGDEDDDDDQVPIPTRSSIAHRPKVEQGVKQVPHVPDPPVSFSGQRRRGARSSEPVLLIGTDLEIYHIHCVHITSRQVPQSVSSIMDRPNKAIYMLSDGKHETRIIDEPYIPKKAQSLVDVQYSGINPADTRHMYMNMTNYVAGYEFTGIVKQVGPDSPFKPGQGLFGISLMYDRRPNYLGAHQSFLLAEPLMTFVRPDHLDPVTAVTLLAGGGTAMDGLFNVLGYGFPPADIPGNDPKDVPILIWGGAGSVGQAAIQLAKAAGFYPIITTASSQNHEAMEQLGASHVFDYKSSSVVQDIRTLLKASGWSLKTVFDAVSTGLGVFDGLTEEQEKAVQEKYDQSSSAMARKCCDPNVPSSELRLTSVLPVKKDPTYVFCLNFRPIEVLSIGNEGAEWSEEFKQAEISKMKEWQARIEKGVEWLIDNHEKYWQPPRTRVVKGVEEGLQGIRDVWKGKVSREKLVIDHRA